MDKMSHADISFAVLLHHCDDWSQNVRLVRLGYEATHHHLVDYKMRLLYVEHYVELADVLEVFIQRLYEVVDELQETQLVLHCRQHHATYDVFVVVDPKDEVKRGIPPVDNLVLAVLEEAALILSSAEALANQFALQRDSFADAKTLEVLGKARLSLLVDHEYELNHL